jgi:hypothetical protein
MIYFILIKKNSVERDEKEKVHSSFLFPFHCITFFISFLASYHQYGSTTFFQLSFFQHCSVLNVDAGVNLFFPTNLSPPLH